MRFSLLTTVVMATSASIVSARAVENGAINNIVSLTPQQHYDTIINGHKDVVMLYYASWCPHCHAFGPIYERVVKYYQDAQPRVTAAQIDAGNYSTFEPFVNIIGFPTIYLFPRDHVGTPIEYQGRRGFEDILDFVTANADGRKGV